MHGSTALADTSIHHADLTWTPDSIAVSLHRNAGVDKLASGQVFLIGLTPFSFTVWAVLFPAVCILFHQF